MRNHEAYYYEDNTLKRYYCKLNNRKFKTKEKYLQYVEQNNLTLDTINIFRKARFSQKSEEKLWLQLKKAVQMLIQTVN